MCVLTVIGIRSFASSCSELTAQTDLYIQNHLLEVMNNSREFFALKKLRFDILGRLNGHS